MPWDIGAAQPDLVQLIEQFPPRSRVLDLGCGTGDLVIELARAGWSMIGIDFVPAAIEVARSRAATLPPEQRSLVQFKIADAFDLHDFEGEVDSVVDSGFFHLFRSETRRRLVRELSHLIPVGGRYFLLGFAISLPANDVPREVTTEEIDRLFNEQTGWVIRASRPARFLTIGLDEVPAIAVRAERLEASRAT